MIATETMSATLEQSDSELVSLTLTGDQEAFARIVGRYQSLICSLTYSATGNLTRSEDLAQETFIAAWKELRHLREPERLRSWLCAIARNRIHTAFRKQHREPVHGAEALDTADSAAHHTASTELPPSERAISQEEEALLWRSLETLPDTYREPLILFYREEQSVARVAESLELTEEAVRKRLARGRKILQEQVVAFVEGSLRQTSPGKVFTMAVIAALPSFAATSATAATLGGAGVKASFAAKTATALGIGAAALGPFVGFLGALFGSWMSIKNTRSPRERQFMIRQTYVVYTYGAVFIGGLLAVRFWGPLLAAKSKLAFGLVLAAWVILYCAVLVRTVLKANRRQKQIRREDGVKDLNPAPASSKASVYGSVFASTLGSLTWMVILAIQMKQWGTAATIVGFGVVVSAISVRRLLRRPEKRTRVLLQLLVAIGIFTVVMWALHSEWPGYMRDQ